MCIFSKIKNILGEINKRLSFNYLALKLKIQKNDSKYNYILGAFPVLILYE